MRTLARCLESIKEQDYPREKIEIIIVDGGSRDRTLEIAKEFGVDKVLCNPLRTGEAGKAVGVEASKNEIILFQDSDNILDERDWLRRMVEPFRNSSVIGAEPLYYTYRKHDSLITRYCALLGMNDPLCLYLGNYDKYSYVTGKWTEDSVKVKDEGKYLHIELNEGAIPTFGANGFLVRAEILKKLNYRPYLFDVDIVYQLVVNGRNQFSKVKIGITHLFADDLQTFVKKTHRRIRDYLYYSKYGFREYPWHRMKQSKLLRFILYSLVLFPLSRDLIKGYKRVSDKAWSFHPVACWITFMTYAMVYATSEFQKYKGGVIKQIPLFRSCYYKNWRLLLRKPLYTAVFIRLKLLETLATALGLLKGKFESSVRNFEREMRSLWKK